FTVSLLGSGGVAAAGAVRAGFDSKSLPKALNPFSSAEQLGFTIECMGRTHTEVYVNENGHLQLSNWALLSTPVPLNFMPSNFWALAPFLVDVDIRGAGSVTYGTGTVDGRAAFGATWSGVGYASNNSDKLNTFQAVIIDRSDT